MDQTSPTGDQPKPSGRKPALWIGVLIVIVALGVAGIYGIAGRTGNGEAAICAESKALAKSVDAVATGEVAALIVNETPRQVADLAFLDDTGRKRTLSEWKGRAVLFNLWATWCAPCRHEMPALDALQNDLGNDDFEVVTVNIDAGDDVKPKKFLDEVKVENLAYYADHSNTVFRELKKQGRAFGLPTTLLIDRNGCEIAHMAGPAQWDSGDAKAVIRLLKEGKPAG